MKKIIVLLGLEFISASLSFFAPLAYKANVFSSSTISLFRDYPIPELAWGMVGLTVLLIGIIIAALFVQWGKMKPFVVVTAILALALLCVILYVACTETDNGSLFSAVKSMISELSPHPIAIFNIVLSLGIVIYASVIKDKK